MVCSDSRWIDVSLESKDHSSVNHRTSLLMKSDVCYSSLNRNIKPDSIYLRGENNEESCSLVIGDVIPASVSYDLRMRTRLPRRKYHHPLFSQQGIFIVESRSSY